MSKRGWHRTINVIILVSSPILLLSAGGAGVYLAPIFAPALIWLTRPSPSRLFRYLNVFVVCCFVAEFVWAVGYSSAQDSRIATEFLPVAAFLLAFWALMTMTR